MDITQFIQPFIGTIVGGAVVIITNWANTRAERRKTAQESYRQIYIIGAIDPIVTYLIGLELQLRNKGLQAPLEFADSKDISVGAIAKIQIIVGAGLSIASIIISLNKILHDNSTDKDDIALRNLAFTCDAFLDFREKCLKEMSTKLGEKSDRVSQKLTHELYHRLVQVQTNLESSLPYNSGPLELGLKDEDVNREKWRENTKPL